ncbi:MAG: hypothetical protein ACREQW_15200 [Candidatus Binatia bacterium]
MRNILGIQRTPQVLYGKIVMSLRILFDENATEQQQKDEPIKQDNGAGWPKDTWFQRRLRYVREQQRKKPEGDIVYACALGTIIIRQSNGEN